MTIGSHRGRAYQRQRGYAAQSLLLIVIAVFSLALVTTCAVLASRVAGWRGALFGLALLLGWVAWISFGPKP